METNKTNTDNSPKSPNHMANFSPTGQYQYEDSNQEEIDPLTNVREFNEENQALIEDETNLMQLHENDNFEQLQDEISENANRELMRELQPENARANANETDNNLDTEFYQHSLQYLVQNLNDLRDTLQTILVDNGLTQELTANNHQNIRNQNAQNNILNNEEHLHDQLRDIRRLLAGNQNRDQILNPLEQQNLQNNHQRNFLNNTNPQQNVSSWMNSIEGTFRQILTSIPKSFNFMFWTIFSISITLIISGASNLPTNAHYQNPDFFLQWLAFHKNSRLFLLGFILFSICLLYKFNQMIYSLFIAEPGENFHKTMLNAILKYSRFYDISLFILIDTSIIVTKLDMFFINLILVWYTMSYKITNLIHQKLNQAAVSIHQQADNSYVKMKRAQFVAAIYLIVNLHISYLTLWLAWYSSYTILFVLFSLALLANLEPLKVFLSGSILIKNYSLVSNNNTKELSDPKFKVELLIDLIYQFVVMVLIAELGLSSARYFTGFIGLYWLSLNNSVDKLKSCYHKYLNWIKLQKKLDELFPVVERSNEEPEELCSICHENLLVARKLQCGHIFHIKCLIYWLENQKTCPNCRATVTNLTDIMGQNRNESTLGRIFQNLVQPFRNLFRT